MLVRTVRIIGHSGVDSSVVTATEDDVLEGKIFIDKNGLELVGNIPVYKSGDDADTIILDVGDHYNVPRGYYEEGAVTIINEKLDFLNGTATQEEVLEGYTIPIGNDFVEGVIKIKQSVNTLLSTGDEVLFEPGYYPTEFTITCVELASQTIATAIDTDITTGKTAWVNGELITGRMPVNTTINMELLAGQSVQIPAGRYDEVGVVRAKALSDQTVGNAAAGDILINKIAWVNGKKIIGIMANRGAPNQGLNCGATYTIQAGYYSGGKITGNSLSSQTSATAVASNILTGKTAWVNGNKITGIMPNKGAPTTALNCGGTYNIAAGYYSGGKVTANSLSSQTSATARAGDIRKSKTAWVNGSKLTGTMTEKGAATYTPSTSNQTISANQFLTGVQTIKGDSNLISANILKGKTIFGVVGTAQSGGIKKQSGDHTLRRSTHYIYLDNGNRQSFYVVETGVIVAITPVYLFALTGEYSINAQSFQSNGVFSFNRVGYGGGGWFPYSSGNNSTNTSAMCCKKGKPLTFPVPPVSSQDRYWWTVLGY